MKVESEKEKKKKKKKKWYQRNKVRNGKGEGGLKNEWQTRSLKYKSWRMEWPHPDTGYEVRYIHHYGADALNRLLHYLLLAPCWPLIPPCNRLRWAEFMHACKHLSEPECKAGSTAAQALSYVTKKKRRRKKQPTVYWEGKKRENELEANEATVASGRASAQRAGIMPSTESMESSDIAWACGDG